MWNLCPHVALGWLGLAGGGTWPTNIARCFITPSRISHVKLFVFEALFYKATSNRYMV